jgi:type II secretory pathway component PulF
VRSNDLPGVLTLLADHYHRANALWTRLKGIMVYPLIVVVVSFCLTILASTIFTHYLAPMFHELVPHQLVSIYGVWLPPVLLGIASAAGLAAVTIPGWREKLRWRVPAFREASLSRLASAMTLLLKSGVPLPEALALAETLESNTSAGRPLARWRALTESGQGKSVHWTGDNRPFPPLFVWLVQQGGEDVAGGFGRAAEIYHDRAAYRIELALYGALPVSVLFLGLMVFWQVAPLLQGLVKLMNWIGNSGMD